MIWIMEYLIYFSGLLLGIVIPPLMIKEGVSKKYSPLLVVLFTLLMYLVMGAGVFTQVKGGIDISKTPFLGFLVLFLLGGIATSFIVGRK